MLEKIMWRIKKLPKRSCSVKGVLKGPPVGYVCLSVSPCHPPPTAHLNSWIRCGVFYSFVMNASASAYTKLSVNPLPHNETFWRVWERNLFSQNIVGKGENAGKQHFLLFSQCFLLYQRQKLSFMLTFILSSANAFNLDEVNFLPSGKGLKKTV